MLGCLIRLTGCAFIAIGIGLAANQQHQSSGGAIVALGVLLLWFTRRKRRAWGNDAATQAQKDFADRLGISYNRRITKGELSDRIDRALIEEKRKRR